MINETQTLALTLQGHLKGYFLVVMIIKIVRACNYVHQWT